VQPVAGAAPNTLPVPHAAEVALICLHLPYPLLPQPRPDCRLPAAS
jgi:hypothetical protein